MDMKKMRQQIIKELEEQQTINSLYECIQNLYSSEKETPEQVFKNPTSLKVFSFEDFVEEGLNSFIKLSIAEGADSLFWLPANDWIDFNQYVKIDLSCVSETLYDDIRTKWHKGNFGLFTEYGCIFNEKKKWVVQISEELELVVMGIFQDAELAINGFQLEAYTKERFLEEYENFPEDYLNLSYKAAEKDAQIINEAVVYPMIKNYFD
ncbi:hypothetical protein [Listeria kieliensis]|uniref:Uncharacterized protein n=1 Tax=Listeria kieliensis TaxID=1621700 RepID=A0A3D8TQ14_9LIST|nr:hypothetical protein [Listeria kieliensis]RDX00722.1 hypothetical protein UR08_06990 [Listeria kieliensis]